MGILAITVLFIGGAYILTKVDLDEGEKMAQEHLSLK